MSESARLYVDDSIPRIYESALVPLFAWRYENFDIDKHAWDEGLESLMYVSCEALRARLSGPERNGKFELEELADRFILKFDACGSGGYTLRGEWVESTPARVEPPHNFRVSEEERDWNHHQKVACLYCAHCIILMGHVPMACFGYSVHVVDLPIYPDTDKDPDVCQKCEWTMHNDPTTMSEKMHTRCSRTRSKEFGSRAHRAVDLPDPTVFRMPGSG